MNDYWNEPPDMPEPPECCGDFMDIMDDGTAVCPECGHKVEPMPDIEPVLNDLPEEQMTIDPDWCRHGTEHGECHHCEHLADIAFDAARESRR